MFIYQKYMKRLMSNSLKKNPINQNSFVAKVL